MGQPPFSASGPGNFPPSGPPMGSIPPGKPNFGQLPPQPQSDHFNPPPLQPPFGQPPQNQFGQPPLLNKTQYGQPPLPGGQNQFGQPPSQFGQPPLPGPPQMNPSQLANQMQGMNLGGPRQYPGAAPMKSGLDSGPHMPPPLSQQQQNLVNGQQLRSPQAPGYPPVPGQGGPGGYPQSGYQQAQQRRLDPDQMPSPVRYVLFRLHLSEKIVVL